MDKWRKQLTRGKRLVIVVLIMGAFLYGVLVMAQRSKEPMRQGLQDYLSQATGGNAEITSMEKVQLVPDVIFHMSGIVVRDRADKDKIIAKADAAYVAVPFLGLMFGIPNYQGFEMRGVEVASGSVLPKKLSVDFAGISAPEGQTSPAFLVEGVYNNLPLMATAEMVRKKGTNPVLYTFADVFSTTFKLGEIEGAGIVFRKDGHVEKGHISRGLYQADFDLINFYEKPMNIYAQGRINGATFNANLTKSGDAVKVDITPLDANANDIKTIKEFVKLIEKDFGLPEENPGLIITVKE